MCGARCPPTSQSAHAHEALRQIEGNARPADSLSSDGAACVPPDPTPSDRPCTTTGTRPHKPFLRGAGHPPHEEAAPCSVWGLVGPKPLAGPAPTLKQPELSHVGPALSRVSRGAADQQDRSERRRVNWAQAAMRPRGPSARPRSLNGSQAPWMGRRARPSTNPPHTQLTSGSAQLSSLHEPHLELPRAGRALTRPPSETPLTPEYPPTQLRSGTRLTQREAVRPTHPAAGGREADTSQHDLHSRPAGPAC